MPTQYRKPMRVYVDTSVVNGAFDHAEQTRPFWNAVINGKIKIIVSDTLEQELRKAPEHVREFLADLPPAQIERVLSTHESNALANTYVAAGVISTKHLTDCKHIALASVHRADCLVSWNFKDIVNLNKIRGYNGVNIQNGYPAIDIITPYILINGDEKNDEQEN